MAAVSGGVDARKDKKGGKTKGQKEHIYHIMYMYMYICIDIEIYI